MNMDKPMTILLVEDNIIDASFFEDYCYSRNDVRIIGIAKSVKESLNFVKTHLPEGIVLDIMLKDKYGTGLNFLYELKKLKLSSFPSIAVVTSLDSKTVHASAYQNGADLVFEKLKDYSPEIVIENLLLLRKSKCDLASLEGESCINVESLGERKQRISDRINKELDLIGIGSHLVGRKYIHDSIMYILEDNNNNGDTAFIHLTKEYKKGKTTIGRAIQTAIEHAWRKSSTDDLKKYYTATIDYNVGVPKPIEFIYYYVDKIRKSI